METEKQRMIAGELYMANDPELFRLRLNARHLLRQFNNSPVEDERRRQSLIKELFGEIEEPFTIEPHFYCDYGFNIIAGKNLFMNFGCIILDCARVDIGDSVLFGPYVQIYTAAHPLDSPTRAAGAELAKPVGIGDRVWLGGGVIVCPGVTIGPDTTIGAGSVVTRDIPGNVFAAGNPCKIIREL